MSRLEKRKGSQKSDCRKIIILGSHQSLEKLEGNGLSVSYETVRKV